MEQWNIIKAYDYCYNVTDGTHDSPKQTEFGKYLITSKHIKDNRIDFESAYKISEDDYNKIITRSKVDQWDIIISMIGAYCGFCCIESSKQTDYAIKNVGLLKVGNELKCKWLYYYLTSPHGKQQLSKLRSGSSQPYISLGALRNLDIPVPNENTMSDIVSVLSSLDSKIELNRRINDNLEEQAKALFKSWFVDSDRNEWVHYELGDITLITAGGDRPSKYTNKKTIECYVPIYSNGIDNEGLYGYTDVAKIHEESITISARGTIGYVCLRLEPYVPIVRLISIIPNKKELSAKYLYLWALTQNITGTGTTQQQLTVPIFRKTPISIPSDTKLKQFNSIADPLFSQIESNKKENIKLSTLRDTLLPKLMSGELSVEEVSLD